VVNLFSGPNEPPGHRHPGPGHRGARQGRADRHLRRGRQRLRGSGDVAIGLSHTGTTVDTIDALREARSHGATTAAVTNFPWSPITEVADLVLITAARQPSGDL
jgi:DNA-binding MurR/RpiR family transcriptional regulator